MDWATKFNKWFTCHNDTVFGRLSCRGCFLRLKITAPGTLGNWSQLGTSWLFLPSKLKVTGVSCEKPNNHRLHRPSHTEPSFVIKPPYKWSTRLDPQGQPRGKSSKYNPGNKNSIFYSKHFRLEKGFKCLTTCLLFFSQMKNTVSPSKPCLSQPLTFTVTTTWATNREIDLRGKTWGRKPPGDWLHFIQIDKICMKKNFSFCCSPGKTLVSNWHTLSYTEEEILETCFLGVQSIYAS